jgi:hypothetical protein
VITGRACFRAQPKISGLTIGRALGISSCSTRSNRRAGRLIGRLVSRVQLQP